MLNQKILKTLFSYDSATGDFTRLVRTSNNTKVGEIAGYLRVNGYVEIRINWEPYLAHRLAWLYMHGNWPVEQIDHINGVRNDNRFCNLREATRSQNLQNVFKPSVNNTSGLRGVVYHKRDKKYQAQIRVDGAQKHLGSFNTPEEASAAYLAAKKIHHPFSFN